ncbi:MAG: hypothetical protein GXO63_02875 [Candidatus Micrarchaeota archaeon]|nr:hypothetical protein [Candidatus Micrarchaeota archaeon]
MKEILKAYFLERDPYKTVEDAMENLLRGATTETKEKIINCYVESVQEELMKKGFVDNDGITDSGIKKLQELEGCEVVVCEAAEGAERDLKILTEVCENPRQRNVIETLYKCGRIYLLGPGWFKRMIPEGAYMEKKRVMRFVKGLSGHQIVKLDTLPPREALEIFYSGNLPR